MSRLSRELRFLPEKLKSQEAFFSSRCLNPRRRTCIVERLYTAYMQVNHDVIGSFWMLYTGSCSRTLRQRTTNGRSIDREPHLS